LWVQVALVKDRADVPPAVGPFRFDVQGLAVKRDGLVKPLRQSRFVRLLHEMIELSFGVGLSLCGSWFGSGFTRGLREHWRRTQQENAE